jgi:hypothetical protein
MAKAATDDTSGAPLLWHLTGCFPAINQRKKTTKLNPHSPKGLKGALQPPDRNRGDKTPHNPNGWGTLASTGKLGSKQNPSALQG